MSTVTYRPVQVRCWACHCPVARFGERWERSVHVCAYCLRIARHDADSIHRFVRIENAHVSDVAHVRMRVRSAIHYAWLKAHGQLGAQRDTR